MSLFIEQDSRVMIATSQRQPGLPDFLCGVYRNGDHLLQCYHIAGRELGGHWVSIALFRPISEASAFPYTDMGNLRPETFEQLVGRIGMKEICAADPFVSSAFGPVRLAMEGDA